MFAATHCCQCEPTPHTHTHTHLSSVRRVCLRLGIRSLTMASLPSPQRSLNFDESSGLFLTDQGLPILWSCPEPLLARTINYDLPALCDAPPWSLAQLSRNTHHEVLYYSFLFRAWPLSSGAADLAFQPQEQLACFLARVVRQLVSDHPGHLFVQFGSRVDRLCRIGVVPSRHSRTQGVLDFGAQIASAPAFALYCPSDAIFYACRFLTVPQNRAEPVLTADSPRFRPLSCSPPWLLLPLLPCPAILMSLIREMGTWTRFRSKMWT